MDGSAGADLKSVVAPLNFLVPMAEKPETEDFQKVVPWLMLNRKGLAVLVYPLTHSSYEDRSKNALWLGSAVPLKLDALRPAHRAELLPKG